MLKMSRWEMAPHTVNGEKTFRVGATFEAPADEHYYGLGQNQEGILDLSRPDHRLQTLLRRPGGRDGVRAVHGHQQGLRHRLGQPVRHRRSRRGERPYALEVQCRRACLLFRHRRRDAPTSCMPGIASSPAQRRCRPRRPSATSRARRATKRSSRYWRSPNGYRSRGYPLDVMVLDWFYWTRMGQLDIDPTAFPDPQAMNQTAARPGRAHASSASGRASRRNRAISISWRRRAGCSQDKDGKPVDGLADAQRSCRRPDRQHQPEAREWYWDRIRDNIAIAGIRLVLAG